MEFDIHTLRGVMSALILLVFVMLFVWVSVGGRDRFRDAAALPFADDDGATHKQAESIDEAREPQA